MSYRPPFCTAGAHCAGMIFLLTSSGTAIYKEVGLTELIVGSGSQRTPGTDSFLADN